MAFKLTGVTTVDMTTEPFSREIEGNVITIQLLPMTPQMQRAGRDRAKVRADTDGMMVLADMDKLQRELAVEAFSSWDIENEKGNIAKLNQTVLGWLADFSEEADTMIREALQRSRAMYKERRDALAEDDAEGN